jgi:predicted GIY-YIG superfamily endonuclease
MTYHVYILRCSDNTYYIGWSENVAKRVKAHNNGTGAPYTLTRRPVVLVYQEKCESKNAVISRERQIKKWSRAKKEALISGNLENLKKLSKSRGYASSQNSQDP